MMAAVIETNKTTLDHFCSHGVSFMPVCILLCKLYHAEYRHRKLPWHPFLSTSYLPYQSHSPICFAPSS